MKLCIWVKDRLMYGNTNYGEPLHCLNLDVLLMILSLLALTIIGIMWIFKKKKVGK